MSGSDDTLAMSARDEAVREEVEKKVREREEARMDAAASATDPSAPLKAIMLKDGQQVHNYVQDCDFRSRLLILELEYNGPDLDEPDSSEDEEGISKKEKRKKKKKKEKEKRKKESDRSVICGAIRVRFEDGELKSDDDRWSNECWLRHHILIYRREKGIETVDEVADTVRFLSKTRGIGIYQQAYEVFRKRYPFLCSKRKSKPRRFPSEILPGQLYLGDMAHAKNCEGLEEMGISFILSVYHDRPELKVDARTVDWLFLEAMDSEKQDLTPLFDRSVKFLTRAVDNCKSAAYVHCGKGVSRSTTLILAYLMKAKNWSLSQALKHCQSCRPIVNPNAGFCAQLREWNAKRLHDEEREQQKKEKQALKGDDEAAIQEDDEEEEEDEGVSQIPQEMIAKMACKPKFPNVRFLEYKGGEQVREISLSQRAMYTIGRGDELRVKLGRSAVDLRLMHPSLSRKHAILIHNDKGHVLLYDAHSSHGTFVDGKRMPPGECWRLNNGQKVKFGASTREYVFDGAGSKWDLEDAESEDEAPPAKKSKWAAADDSE